LALTPSLIIWIADEELLRVLQESQNDWSDYKDEPRRSTAITRFHEYAYQWF